MHKLLQSVLTSTVLLLAAVPAWAAPSSYSVSNIKAFLYYDDAGEIGQSDLTQLPEGKLFNTFIGEGIADGPSNATFVLVEVSGPDFANHDIGKLNLKASIELFDGEKTKQSLVHNQTVDVNFFFNEGKTKIYIPFLVYMTGGSEMTLVATLTGGKDAQNKTTSITKKIKFGGGE